MARGNANTVICGGFSNLYTNRYDTFSTRDYDPQRKPRDITDGLTHTATFSERLVQPYAMEEEPLGLRTDVIAARDPIRYAWYISTGPYRDVGLAQEFFNACRTNRTTVEYSLETPRLLSLRGHGLWYDHLFPPNSFACYNGEGSWEGNLAAAMNGAYPATSAHPSSVHTAFADGHVQAISSHIDMAVWHALGTISENEIVDSF